MPDNAMNLLSIMADNAIRDLDIMGGEPFLLPWMPSFIHAFVRAGIKVNISTNGSIPEALDALAGIAPGMLDIGVSLEGSTAEKHNFLTRARNFDAAIQSISLLESLGFDPIVKTVLSRKSMADIPAIVALLKTLGVRRFYLIHLDLFSASPAAREDAMGYSAFRQFHESIRAQNRELDINRVNASCFEKDRLPAGVRCAGGVRKLSVMPDGSVYPCNLFQHFPEFRVGNIFSDDFADMWQSPMFDLFRRAGENRCGLEGCSNRESCTGGCPAHARYHALAADAADVRCL